MKILFQILTIEILLITKINSHVAKNDPDVIITYSGHAEANPDVAIGTKTEATTEKRKTTKKHKTTSVLPTFENGNEKEDVVFIPNERDGGFRDRDDDFLDNDAVMISDVLKSGFGETNIKLETESPNKDILFISGKNNENYGETEKKVKKDDTRRSGKEMEEMPAEKLYCSNLNCNSTLKAVCGGKIEHKKWKYRLFYNECYFRKVNCGFSYEFNRYHRVSKSKCKNIGAHYSERPYVFRPSPSKSKQENKSHVIRKKFASRRSLIRDIDGLSCSHTCPIACPDDYEPQCAVSSAGNIKVFVNHCRLDYDSCTHGLVWHLRPLSTCVGGKKADMRQNRAFIGWMQRVGIVDNKGRLALS